MIHNLVLAIHNRGSDQWGLPDKPVCDKSDVHDWTLLALPLSLSRVDNGLIKEKLPIWIFRRSLLLLRKRKKAVCLVHVYHLSSPWFYSAIVYSHSIEQQYNKSLLGEFLIPHNICWLHYVLEWILLGHTYFCVQDFWFTNKNKETSILRTHFGPCYAVLHSEISILRTPLGPC